MSNETRRERVVDYAVNIAKDPVIIRTYLKLKSCAEINP